MSAIIHCETPCTVITAISDKLCLPSGGVFCCLSSSTACTDTREGCRGVGQEEAVSAYLQLSLMCLMKPLV